MSPFGLEATSVVVPLFNGRALIADCLRSIPPGVEIVVVDDGSTDGAPELVEQDFPEVTLLRNERNRGFGTTSNRGLHACHRPVRVVLNSDARFRAAALERLAASFDDPRIGIAGPRLVFPDGSHQTSAASFPTPGSVVTGAFLLNEVYRRICPNGRFPFELGLARRDHAEDRDVDWVMGTCLAIRDTCLAAVGGFDESYYMYAEETDLCWRAGRAGWRVRYVAGAEVVHLGAGSTGDPTEHARRSIVSEARFMERAYGRRAMWKWRLARGGGALLKVLLLAAPALIDRRVRVRLRWQVAALRLAFRGAGTSSRGSR